MKKLLLSSTLLIAAAILLTAPITYADDMDDLCRNLGALASSTLKAKNAGASLQKILTVARDTKGPKEAHELTESTIKIMYDSDLHPDDAEMITYIACKRQLGGRQ